MWCLTGQALRLGVASANLPQATQDDCARGQSFFAEGAVRVLRRVLIEQRKREGELTLVQRALGAGEEIELARQRRARLRSR